MPGSTLRLSEAARHLVYPPKLAGSVFPDVEDRLSEVDVEFDLWQRGFGTIALGLDESGKFASTIGGVSASIPRQTGKTFTIGNLLIGLCLLFPGFRAIWTSHHLSTTKNTLQSMEGMTRKPRLWPHIRNVYTNNNDMRIQFTNGSVILFGAREHGYGRGLDAIDALVFDEAQKLGLKALEDMVPATNQARNPHGALVFFIGTPPRPIDDGEAFTAKRRQALDGDTDDDMVYVEFSADPDADLDDRSQWPIMNPSYPSRTPLESMLRMRKNMPDDESWRREAMGIWPISGGGLISPDLWASLVDSGSTPTDPVSFGVYVNQMQTSAAIAVAAYRADGNVHIGVVPAASSNPAVTALPGTRWIPARVKELAEKWKPCATVIDGRSAAASLIPAIEELGVEVTTTTAGDMARACGNFLAGVNEGTLRHQGIQALTTSVLAGKKRDLSDAWAWDRKDKTSDITQLVAVTLALHGLIVHGRPPVVEVWEPFWT